jgi:hypothetical protein
VPSPLYVIGGSFLVTNGGGTSTVLGVGVGSSGCAPGNGSVSVGSGSGSGLCSVTPSSLTVTLSP